MKRIGQFVLAAVAIAAFFALGSFLVGQGITYLHANELVYSRQGQSPIVTSAQAHPFSFYYQIAFWLSLGLFFVLLAICLCLFSLAKLIRSAEQRNNRSATGTHIYRAAMIIGYGSVASMAIWVVLRVFRSALIQ